MPRHAEDKNIIKSRILDATIEIFNEYGLKFTMDELASRLAMSKKTIYSVFPDKHALLYEMVDYVFDYIRAEKTEVAKNEDLELTEKLRQVMGMLTDKFENIDLSKLHILSEKYPDVYAHVAERLENQWEETIELLNRGVKEGIFREFSIPIFKLMMESTLESFFRNDILVRNNISYRQALDQVVDILLEGIII